MTHAGHLVATLFTCGFWLPIWVLCALVGAIVPMSCTICSNPFKRNRHLWTIDGQKEHLCSYCNQSMERRQSRQAIRRRF